MPRETLPNTYGGPRELSGIVSSEVRRFVRDEAPKYAAFAAFSAAAVALAPHATSGDPLGTPLMLALAVSLILSGSLAVVLAEACLDNFLAARADATRVAVLFLAVGVATLTAAILVFYVAVYA